MERDFPFSDDRRPLGYLGRLPITVSNLVIAANGALLLLLLILAGSMGRPLGQAMAYLELSPRRVVENFEAWRLLTYPLGETTWGILTTTFSMLAFYFWGNEVEQCLGRRVYGWSLVLLWFVPAAFVMGLYPFDPTAVYGGASAFYLSIVFAFTVLYPSTEVFMRMEARWIGMSLVIFSLFMALIYREWTLLLALFVSFVTCFVVLRRLGYMHSYLQSTWGQGAAQYPSEGYRNSVARDFLREQERMRKLASLESHSFEGVGTRSKTQHAVVPEQLVEEEPQDVYEVIDPLLEKITQHGLESLTAAERASLESARLRLMEMEDKK